MSIEPVDVLTPTSLTEAAPSTSPVEVDLLQQLDDGRPLPRRERVTTPLTYVLLGAFSLLLAFGAGAWAQKHHGATSTTSTAAATNPAAAFAAGAGNRAGGFGAGAAGAGTGAAGTGAAGTGALGGATVGQIKLVDGNNVYVTDQQGATVKITLAAGGTVQVTKDGAVSDLKAGETVIVQGQAGSDGTIAATSIRTSAAGALGAGGAGIGGRGAGGGATATTAAPAK